MRLAELRREDSPSSATRWRIWAKSGRCAGLGVPGRLRDHDGCDRAISLGGRALGAVRTARERSRAGGPGGPRSRLRRGAVRRSCGPDRDVISAAIRRAFRPRSPPEDWWPSAPAPSERTRFKPRMQASTPPSCALCRAASRRVPGDPRQRLQSFRRVVPVRTGPADTRGAHGRRCVAMVGARCAGILHSRPPGDRVRCRRHRATAGVADRLAAGEEGAELIVATPGTRLCAEAASSPSRKSQHSVAAARPSGKALRRPAGRGVGDRRGAGTGHPPGPTAWYSCPRGRPKRAPTTPRGP